MMFDSICERARTQVKITVSATAVVCVVHLNFDPLMVNIGFEKKKKEPKTRIYDLNTLKFLLEWMRNCENPSDSQCFQQS